jgi:hypothetical protein
VVISKETSVVRATPSSAAIQGAASSELAIEASISKCAPAIVSIEDFIGIIFSTLQAQKKNDSDPIRHLKNRLLSSISSCNGYGHPFCIRSNGHGGLTLRSNRTKGLIPTDGIYRTADGMIAMLSMQGIALGVIVKPHRRRYGIINRIGDYVVDRSSSSTIEYRKQLSYNANTKSSEINQQWLSMLHGDHQITSLAQYIHRHWLPTEGAIVLHDDRGFISNVERHKKEALVFSVARELFHGHVVRRRYRGSELQGLELDVWIPQFRIGIEYQGEGHDRSIKAWRGDDGYRDRVKNDNRKRDLCISAAIILIEIWHHEDVSPSGIRKKIISRLTEEHAKILFPQGHIRD